MRVIVLGGYGNFGARICRALTRDRDIEVIAAGRDPDRGYREAHFTNRVKKQRIDCSDSCLPSILRGLMPQLVIHCAGPFQGQGYHVARASLEAGAHYIDLADGREFVARFASQIDPVARAAELFATSGASSVPALSAAVVDHLIGRFSALEEIQIAIAPAQRAPRGAATIEAVLSYAGRPFEWLSDGARRTAYGWQELRRLRFAKLGRRWGAACDVPDLELFPERYRGVRTVEFRAALEFGVQHLALWSVARLRRARLTVPLEQWVRPLDRLAGYLDWLGGRRGAMLVSLGGTKQDGTRGRVEWHLTADSNHGPEIPAMPAILLARKLASGELTARGAAPCVGFLALDDFRAEFTRWDIRTHIEETAF